MNKKLYLLRKSLGKREEAPYKSLLHSILDKSIDFDKRLSIEDVDSYFSQIKILLESNFSKINITSGTEDVNILVSMMGVIANSFQHKRCWLITKQAFNVGAFNVDVGSALRSFRSLIELDGDTIYLVSEEKDYVIMVDLFDGLSRIGFGKSYEVTVWDNIVTQLPK